MLAILLTGHSLDLGLPLGDRHRNHQACWKLRVAQGQIPVWLPIVATPFGPYYTARVTMSCCPVKNLMPAATCPASVLCVLPFSAAAHYFAAVSHAGVS